MTYKLVQAADSFFIVDARDVNNLTETKYPSAYIKGSVSHNETTEGGWKRTIIEPVIGAREFAEALIAALNNTGMQTLSEDDSAHLPQAAE